MVGGGGCFSCEDWRYLSGEENVPQARLRGVSVSKRTPDLQGGFRKLQFLQNLSLSGLLKGTTDVSLGACQGGPTIAY